MTVIKNLGRHSRTRQRCIKDKILCIMSDGVRGHTPSITSLFLVFQRTQKTTPTKKSFSLWLEQPSGTSSSHISWRLSGDLPHPKASLKHAQMKFAIGQQNKIWSLVSTTPQTRHFSSPFQFLFLSSSPVCNLSWKTCHIKTFSFIGNFVFQSLHKRVLTTLYVPRTGTWIW
jgi:hypothetical protein